MKRGPYLHIALFALTFCSTLIAGAMQRGVDPIANPSGILQGLPFSVTLMLILLSHELSHYFSSRLHNTQASLPYFIPAPSLFGTFGAFIKMTSPIETRAALIDIGASGPLVGFVFSVIASAIGLSMSEIVAVSPENTGMELGDSILFTLLAKAIVGNPAGGHDILLHPIAFAGWIGLFVTSLNLIPIGQLDGGHIAYAILGVRHRRLSIAMVVTLAILGYFYWPGWAMWAALMLVFGIGHPPVLYWEPLVDRSRRMIAWMAIIVFILTFTPAPFIVSE